MNIRAQAALTLTPILRGEASLQSVFDAAAEKVEAKDRGLFHELVYGTLRQYEWLNEVFLSLVTKKIKNKDLDVAALILVGLYQLEYLRTPDHAAISETVSATKKLKKLWAKSFVNATLRNFTRQRQELIDKVEQKPSAKHRLPTWLLTIVDEDWPDQSQDIFAATQQKAPVTLRHNAKKLDRSALAQELTQQKIAFTESKYSEAGLSLVDSADVNRVEALKAGRASVQDEAAQLAASLLELKAGQRVLDACAAPGGKSCHILESCEGIELSTIDSDKARSDKIRVNLDRLELDAKIYVADASNLEAWWDGHSFDRILIDAPCSATGVIRRHPDIKLLRRESDLVKLAEIQLSLLNALWTCLRPGGILIYATCSILKQENESTVANFLKTQTDAEEIVINADWGLPRPVGRQLLPQLQGHDGFYYAKLFKVDKT